MMMIERMVDMYIQNLQRMMLDMTPEKMPMEMLYDLQEQVWAKIMVTQGSEFYTVEQTPFTYSILEDKMYVAGEQEPITKEIIDTAVEKVMELMRNHESIDGPERIGGYGINYLFPILEVMGVMDELE